ncbi:hypothetical protein ICM05_10220 [Leucobacter sp. cx-42]|uniref:Ig-like domain-containing protein n=1 Tax=unclassified Leucobacter TaxID=2621730 RepID=UPI00165D7C9D|nr:MULTISPECIES: Ig-like domain-containing protein [unclassified Leucobacter]MBC9955006.1 hypothetical protein [Leucobacter sp. cx-42]
MHSARPLAKSSTQRVTGVRALVIALLVFAMSVVSGQFATPASAHPLDGAVTSIMLKEDAAKNWSRVQVDFMFNLPGESHPGDTFSITLPEQLKPLSRGFILRNTAGEAVAEAIMTGQLVTFKLTDFALNHTDIIGEGHIYTEFNSNAGNGSTVTLEFITNEGGKFTDDIVIDETIINRNSVAKSGAWTQLDDQGVSAPDKAIAWNVASAIGPFPELVFTDVVGEHQQLECSTLRVFGTTTVDPITGDLSNLALIDSSRYDLVSCTEDGFELKLPQGTEVNEVILLDYRTTITDSTASLYANTTKIYNGTSTSDATATLERSGGGSGSGTGTGLGELSIIKLLVDDRTEGNVDPEITLSTRFTIEVVCTKNDKIVTGFPKQYEITAATDDASFVPQKQAVPLGAICTATEPDALGATRVEISDPVTIGEDPTALTVINIYEDDPEKPIKPVDPTKPVDPVKPVDPTVTKPTTGLANTGSAQSDAVLWTAVASILLGLGALTTMRLRMRGARR